MNVSGDFQIAPRISGLQRSIISDGQVCDRGSIIKIRSIGGTILNELSGNRIELECSNGVYRVMIDASVKVKSRIGSI